VCPADVDTPMLRFQAERYGRGNPQACYDALLARYPQRAQARFLRPEEVAEAIVALASLRLAPLTGAALPLDFGMTAGF
jgi:NAD(P)-dependent dehydrogenase (short-subunit alcohol dehydrogenase family)